MDLQRAQQLAEESARIMWADDIATRHVGMQLLEVRPGLSRLSMTVRPEFANGHGMCHGGYFFMLADSAFAVACNSHNQKAVAASAAIEFIAPARLGDTLTAECSERHRGGRSGLYDVKVTDQSHTLIALFRGRSATIRGQYVEEQT